jgi:hypothetical protein
LIDAYSAQAPGASPGVDEMAAAKVARRSIRHDVPVHTGEGARLVVSIVLGAVLGGC